MKANAPERLYLSKIIYSTYLYQVPDPDDESAVEYTRSDAFIEKAAEYLQNNVYMHSEKYRNCVIEDFKKYMKGEKL